MGFEVLAEEPGTAMNQDVQIGLRSLIVTEITAYYGAILRRVAAVGAVLLVIALIIATIRSSSSPTREARAANDVNQANGAETFGAAPQPPTPVTVPSPTTPAASPPTVVAARAARTTPPAPGVAAPSTPARVPLSIVKSGYSSATGGTPLEQPPPDNGLPVGAVAGSARDRSFIALSGTGTSLKLEPVPGATAVGAEQAAIKACAITGDWTAKQGASFAEEPKWADPCVDGKRNADGSWTFDLSSFGDPAKRPGFALTPAGMTTFSLTFKPTAAST